MKTNKILTYIGIFALTIMIGSCVSDDEFGIPDVNIPPVDTGALGDETTFSAVVSRYWQAVADGV